MCMWWWREGERLLPLVRQYLALSLHSLFPAKILLKCCLDLNDGWTIFREEKVKKTASEYLTIFLN